MCFLKQKSEAEKKPFTSPLLQIFGSIMKKNKKIAWKEIQIALFCISFFVSLPNRFFSYHFASILRFRTKTQFFCFKRKNCLFLPLAFSFHFQIGFILVLCFTFFVSLHCTFVSLQMEHGRKISFFCLQTKHFFKLSCFTTEPKSLVYSSKTSPWCELYLQWSAFSPAGFCHQVAGGWAWLPPPPPRHRARESLLKKTKPNRSVRFLLLQVYHRKIGLTEGSANCRHLKKLTCKGTLRQVFICHTIRPCLTG